MAEQSGYANAGVDINAGDKVKAMMRQFVETTYGPSVMGDFGGFGGLYSLKELTGSDIILVGSADGVGTKLKLAFATDHHDTVGQDLVNHLVNDILCCGARPLFFFDYLGLGKMKQSTVLEIIKGLSIACKENQTALLGGETAQMPGFYADGEYDLAGFMVGWVRKNEIIDGKSIKPGDKIIGLASSGPHTNGYSLARKAFFDMARMEKGDIIGETGNDVYADLMQVHRPYFKAIEPFLGTGKIKGIAHITGGGFEGNIVRILPENIQAVVETSHWDVPGLFKAIQRISSTPTSEMYQVFNMGIGLTLFCAPDNCPVLLKGLAEYGAIEIGYCETGKRGVILHYE
jgi:phosphoribosylformylglycinamidine cyclo-ligase